MWDTNLILDRWWYLSRVPVVNEVENDIINTKIQNCKHLHAILYESQDHALPGRKLSASACFAFQWYCGNLTNECSFTYSSSSVKCPFCWNWMLGSFKLRKKKKKVLPSLAKMNGSESNFSFHHVPLFWIQQTTYVNFAKEWPLKWRKIELEQIFYCDEGITWPKIFLQNNCGSNKHLAGARARFTRTRLLSVQFNYSLTRMWRRSKFLRNGKTTFKKMY